MCKHDEVAQLDAVLVVGLHDVVEGIEPVRFDVVNMGEIVRWWHEGRHGFFFFVFVFGCFVSFCSRLTG